jgi:hypothetical protein
MIRATILAVTLALTVTTAPDTEARSRHAIDCENRRCVIVRNRGTDDAAILHKGTWKQVEYRAKFNDRDCVWMEDGSPTGC